MKTLEELFKTSPKEAELLWSVKTPSEVALLELIKNYPTTIEFQYVDGVIKPRMVAGGRYIETEMEKDKTPTEYVYQMLASGLLTRLLEEKYGIR